MAIDLFCYSSLELHATTQRLIALKTSRPDIFSSMFPISTARQVDAISRRIAADFGFGAARSMFLVSLNDKSQAARLREVASLVYEAFGILDVVVLFETDKKIPYNSGPDW